jgi:hypothetical protein
MMGRSFFPLLNTGPLCTSEDRFAMVRTFAGFPTNQAVMAKMLLGDEPSACDIGYRNGDNSSAELHTSGSTGRAGELVSCKRCCWTYTRAVTGNEKARQQAISVLDQMRFIGLTECFEESVQLFKVDSAARFRHTRSDWPPVVSVRSSATTAAESKQMHLEGRMLSEIGFPGYDTDLFIYHHAARLFARRLQQHQLSVKTQRCAHALNNVPHDRSTATH